MTENTGVTLEQLRALHRPFEANQIHWRAQTVSERNGQFFALALAYIDARDVMDRFDNTCGPANWQTEHFDAGNGKLGCRLGVFIDRLWIWKSDGAGDTDVEAEKGAFSDALKRAAVSWGVGRYLYDMGNVWVPCDAYKDGNKNKFKKFTADPWAHVKDAQRFLPKPQAKAA